MIIAAGENEPTRNARMRRLFLTEYETAHALTKPYDGVVGALGLELADLYPPRRDRSPGGGAPRERRPWSAGDLLRLAAFESTVVAIGLCDAMGGRRVDFDRLLLAAETLGSIAEVTHAR